MTRNTVEVQQEERLDPSSPTVDERGEQLDRILRGRVFQDAGLLGTLLRYLFRKSTEQPDVSVKEYTIACEVFGRDSEFDPRTNSIVRVQAKNLRAKLQTYYDTEGEDDGVLIEIPKGHYKVVCSYVVLKEPSPPAPSQREEGTAVVQPVVVHETLATIAPSRRTYSTRSLLIAATVILFAAVSALILSGTNARKAGNALVRPDDVDDYAPVWSAFFDSNTSTLLILSNPPVYRFTNNSDSPSTTKNSMEITPDQERVLSKTLGDKLVMKQGRTPRLTLSTSSYTGIGEAIGLYHLTDMFRSIGKGLTLKQSRTVSADDFKNHNVILLGSTWVNEWAEKLPVNEDFVFTVNASIENRKPMPGEESEYRPRYADETGLVEEDYALVTVKPGITEERRLMILAGVLSEGTQAAAEYVTTKEYLAELDRRLLQMAGDDGPPKYYQALLRVGVFNGVPTTVTLLALHPLKVGRD